MGYADVTFVYIPVLYFLCIIYSCFKGKFLFNLGFFDLGKQVAKGRGTCRVEQHERDVMVPFFSVYDVIFFYKFFHFIDCTKN